MSERNSGGKALILIVNALFWAAALLIGAYLFTGRAWSETMTLFMIGGYFVVNGLVLCAKGRATPNR